MDMSLLFGTISTHMSLSLISECVLVITAAEKQVTSAQIREHRGAVLDLIEMYLRGKFMQLVTILTAHIWYLVLCGLFCRNPFVYLQDIYWLSESCV